MFQRKPLFYGVFVSLVTIIVLSGCTLQVPKVAKPSDSQLEPAVSTRSWWYARFKTNWPENTDPPWHLDVMLAHKIVSPVLNQYKDTIGLWRFHRRAARDTGGHLFSFIFYATPGTAQNVYDTFKADPLLKQLIQAGIIIRFISNNTSQVARTDIGDSSDKSWSVPIRKTWPYYIMGVSQMWLHLVSEIAEKNASEQVPSSLMEYLDFYRRVNKSVQASWQEEGQHAFLHHLNAIFGYEPVIIHEKRLMKF